jgi:hypothetical protein
MKRATLSALPAVRQAEPADLTDRLLERERQPSQAEPGAGNPLLPETPRRRRRAPPAIKRPAKQAPADLAPPAPQPTPSIHAALAAADAAAQALKDAGRSAPARYELALRYRLDALAHHLQQVREFVNGLTVR